MEKRSSFEKQSTSSRDNSTKDLSVSHSSIKSNKSNKSLDNQNTNSSSARTANSEDKDKVTPDNLHFSKGLDKKSPVPLDGTTKIPHKFITNWRLACDRTKDRTKELLKRWKTLSEFEGIEHAHGHPHRASGQHKEHELLDNEHNEKSGWSVHVWSE